MTDGPSKIRPQLHIPIWLKVTDITQPDEANDWREEETTATGDCPIPIQPISTTSLFWCQKIRTQRTWQKLIFIHVQMLKIYIYICTHVGVCIYKNKYTIKMLKRKVFLEAIIKTLWAFRDVGKQPDPFHYAAESENNKKKTFL